jgi:hypothetical protein
MARGNQRDLARQKKYLNFFTLSLIVTTTHHGIDSNSLKKQQSEKKGRDDDMTPQQVSSSLKTLHGLQNKNITY